MTRKKQRRSARGPTEIKAKSGSCDRSSPTLLGTVLIAISSGLIHRKLSSFESFEIYSVEYSLNKATCTPHPSLSLPSGVITSSAGRRPLVIPFRVIPCLQGDNRTWFSLLLLA